jgi:hypothetical protein
MAARSAAKRQGEDCNRMKMIAPVHRRPINSIARW